MLWCFERDEDASLWDVKINDVRVEQVNEFVYVSSMFIRDGKIDADVEKRVNVGNKVNNNNIISIIIITQCWVWQAKHESRINAVEIRSLRSVGYTNFEKYIERE